MLVLRVIALSAGLAVAGLVVAWIVTRERRYLQVAWRVAQAVVVLAVAFALLYVFERVLLL